VTDIDLSPDELAHIGILRKSGRYPWGSGKTPNQRNKMFLDHVEMLRKQGMSDVEIARGFDITTTQLRAMKSIAKNEQRASMASQAQRMKDKGMSNVAIGERLGLNESSVRSLLDPGMKERQEELVTIANMLKDQVAEKKYLDVGAGTENHLGISPTKLKTAVEMLKEDDYDIHYVKVQQLGTGKYTTLRVLVPPGTPYSETYKNQDKIQAITKYSEDGGRSFLGLHEPLSVNSKRVGVRYADEGGADMDGVIQVRRGVDDVSLGNSKYAQVRIAVDGTHYLKGMAMYSDDLPDGVDLMFNTNKKDTGNKLDAMKKMKDDPDNPFGSVVRQITKPDANGKERVVSALNIVNEEGDWTKWSKTLSSQMLSKQTPALAKEQLGLGYDVRKAEFDEIMSLTNPAVRKKLLEAFADGADAAAVHLKAAGLPRTASHVILPINSLKDDEIYAPNYRNGEKVVLIRHPHGGIFEIPELTVNNRNREANSIIKNARDAVGINSKVAGRLSGADFDGDTVLVIPNNSQAVKNSKPLAGLKDFDPQKAYPAYPGMKPMTARAKQQQMGDVSNLITDMTIKKASNDEIARAVRHSMVVIDAEKHNLNYRQSAVDNGIKDLKTKYQGGPRAGADTLISKAKSEERIPDQKLRPARLGGPIDPATGKKVYVPTGETYTNSQGKTVVRTVKTTKMANTDNAYKLSSGTPMEAVYADHANRLKSLANNARKAMVATKTIPYSPSAKQTYANEVASLKGKLNVALKNAPLERQAQLVANRIVSAKRQANPDMEAADLKKIKGQALQEARTRVGAKKSPVDITPSEWEAVQAGAISNNFLSRILDHTDLDQVREMATPRERTVMAPAKLARAKNMLASGYTQAEIADALGVPTSTLNSALIEEG